LRDLAGLIVIDFIDMDEKRNNRAVERRLKECLRHDRARIQVGHISHFGLLEMSRQRIRSSVLESSTEKCPHCGGTGHVRSVSSVALQLLRSLDEMLLKGATHNLTVRTRSEIALYLLNHKRAHLRVLEERFRIVIMVNADATVEGQVSFVIEKGEQVHSLEQAKALALQPATAVPAPVDDEEDEDDFEADDVTESEESVAAAPEADGESEGETDQDQAQDQGPDGGQGRKRRRRRRGRRGGEGREVAHAERDNGAFAPEHDADFAPQPGENDLSHAGEGHEAGNGAGGPETPGESGGEAERRRRRRGRRGGRRNRRGREGEGAAAEGGNGEQPEFEQAARDADDGIAAEPEAPAMHVPVAEPHHDLGPQSDLHSQSASAPETPPEPTHMPAAQIAASAGPETAATERSRRRSTVREPAAQVLREQVLREDGPASEPPPAPPTPTAEPVVSSTAEESESPRRSGWWSKRVLGRS
jgi:ribonuclease E